MKTLNKCWSYLKAWGNTFRYPTIQQCVERAALFTVGAFIGASSQADATKTSIGTVKSNIFGVGFIFALLFMILWGFPEVAKLKLRDRLFDHLGREPGIGPK